MTRVPGWQRKIAVAAVFAVFLPAEARAAVFGTYTLLAAIIIQGPFRGIHLEDNISPIAAISAVRSAFFRWKRSRRKLTQPAPPFPDLIVIMASSTNFTRHKH